MRHDPTLLPSSLSPSSAIQVCDDLEEVIDHLADVLHDFAGDLRVIANELDRATAKAWEKLPEK